MARNAAKKMADGGEPTPLPTQDTAEPGPEDMVGETLSADDVNAEPDTPPEPAPAPEEPAPPAQAAPAPAQTPTPKPAAKAPPAAAPQPEAAPAERPPITPRTIAYELPAETERRMMDINSGAIHPKTYADLMPKDFAGRAGTMFGLLLSGMGSGLTGQPNAVMAMMDKQIDRDLDAQKASRSNEMNLYQLNLAHVQQQTASLRSQYENELTAAQIKGVPAEIKLKEAQIKHLTADQQVLADTHTRNDLTMGFLKEAAGQTAKMADGPQKQNAEIALNGVTKQGIGSIQQRNEQTKQRLDFKSALTNMYQEGTPQDEAAFQHAQSLRRMVPELQHEAESQDHRHIAGVPGLASTPLSTEDVHAHESSVRLMRSLKDLRDFSIANPRTVPGTALDAQGKSLAKQLSSDYRDASHGGVFKEGEQGFINQIIPGDPGAWSPFAQVVPKIDALMSQTARNHQGFLHDKGFSVPLPNAVDYGKGKSASSPQANEQVMQDDVTKKKYLVRDGKTIKELP